MVVTMTNILHNSYRSQKAQFKFNISKLQYKLNMSVSSKSDGHKPENEKVQAINKMPQPKNVKDLQCFLGMVNYLNKFSLR